MGNFANTLFSVLLGWLRGAAAWIWQLLRSDGTGGFMSWMMEHWLLMVILLCAAGAAIDLVIYLVRWQPYRVWRSFWAQLGEHEEDMPQEEQPGDAPEVRQWVYADGSTAIETGPQESVQAAAMQPEPTDMQLQTPVRPVRRVIPARRRRAADGSEEFLLTDLGGTKKAYHQPCYPPQWQTGKQTKTDEGDDA